MKPLKELYGGQKFKAAKLSDTFRSSIFSTADSQNNQSSDAGYLTGRSYKQSKVKKVD